MQPCRVYEEPSGCKVLSAGEEEGVVVNNHSNLALPAEEAFGQLRASSRDTEVQALIGITGRKAHASAVCQVGCEIPGLNTNCIRNWQA